LVSHRDLVRLLLKQNSTMATQSSVAVAAGAAEDDDAVVQPDVVEGQ
jgi:hypothetical protein